MTEAKLQKKILDWLTNNGYYVVKVILSNKKGVPDILCCSPEGKFIAIEVKIGKNKTTRLQDYNLSSIRNNNGKAFVAYDLETVIKELK